MNEYSNNQLKKGSKLIEFWSRFVFFLSALIIGSIILGYLDIFYWFSELTLIFVLVFWTKIYRYLIDFIENLGLLRPTFLQSVIFLFFLIWFVLLVTHSPFPAFSGRDEGSYANGAIYLAKNASFFFEPQLLQYFDNEGPAQKSLNYPGFVIKDQRLMTQFSPAYSTLLAVFLLFFDTVKIFIWINGILILGGLIAFYILLKFFIPKWSVVLALLLLLFNFVLIWFPRFTLSENLAFFVNLNVLLFAFLSFFNPQKNNLTTLLAISLVAPLTRPEGFWFLIVGLGMICLVLIKNRTKAVDLISGKIMISAIVGIGTVGYAFFLQWPVYLQLVKDFLKWSSNRDSFSRLGNFENGGFDWMNIASALGKIIPDPAKLFYFYTVEARYGVLVFAIALFVLAIHFLFKQNSNFYDVSIKLLFRLSLLLALPYLMILISPQISQDHPWFLRRFFPLIVPFGLLMTFIFVGRWIDLNLFKKRYAIFFGTFFLLFIVTFPASAYFMGFRIDSGREGALKETADFLNRQLNPFIFVQRESSGDGWRMFSLPLNSIFELEAVYVYDPAHIVNLKKLVMEKSDRGEKTFVLLPANAYNFEHKLKKNYSLILEKQIDYENDELAVEEKSRETDFPLLQKKKNSVKIYSLNLNYD